MEMEKVNADTKLGIVMVVCASATIVFLRLSQLDANPEVDMNVYGLLGMLSLLGAIYGFAGWRGILND
jgi:hypothetical protein